MSESRYLEGAAHELVEQARECRGASRTFARESARTYAAVLDDLFFYYRESIRAAEQSTREG